MLNPWISFDAFLTAAAEHIRAERPDVLVCDDGFEVMVSYGADASGSYAEINGGEPVEGWVPVALGYSEGEALPGNLLGLRLYLDE
jgi:hypothetical protein